VVISVQHALKQHTIVQPVRRIIRTGTKQKNGVYVLMAIMKTVLEHARKLFPLDVLNSNIIQIGIQMSQRYV
jgi:hypothetical protein